MQEEDQNNKPSKEDDTFNVFYFVFLSKIWLNNFLSSIHFLYSLMLMQARNDNRRPAERMNVNKSD